ncbi:MAG: hypothetical protein Q8M40_05965 [Legionella sp.]|nr:hypothetical protein [Legionella sp.]
MAYLILDLDLTVFTTVSQLELIDKMHQLTRVPKGAHLIQSEPEDIYIINFEEIKSLIEYACTEHEGIIILTAGFWDEKSIKTLLIQDLKLDAIADKIMLCPFLAPHTTQDHYRMNFQTNFFSISTSDIYKLPKSMRFDYFKRANPKFADAYGVMVDDSRVHINSFKDDETVKGILATTVLNTDPDDAIPSKEFYKLAKSALDELKALNELNALNELKEWESEMGIPILSDLELQELPAIPELQPDTSVFSPSNDNQNISESNNSFRFDPFNI